VCANCDLKALHRHIEESLPEYARPLFLRMRKDIDVTATFKQKKVDLVKEGFDPDKIADPLYFNDASAKAFVPIDRALYERIVDRAKRILTKAPA
jgi:fatty-acyl-CoA synthase